jgi:hypothetical protein
VSGDGRIKPYPSTDTHETSIDGLDRLNEYGDPAIFKGAPNTGTAGGPATPGDEPSVTFPEAS